MSCSRKFGATRTLKNGQGWIRTSEGVKPADLQSAPFGHFGTYPSPDTDRVPDRHRGPARICGRQLSMFIRKIQPSHSPRIAAHRAESWDRITRVARFLWRRSVRIDSSCRSAVGDRRYSARSVLSVAALSERRFFRFDRLQPHEFRVLGRNPATQTIR